MRYKIAFASLILGAVLAVAQLNPDHNPTSLAALNSADTNQNVNNNPSLNMTKNGMATNQLINRISSASSQALEDGNLMQSVRSSGMLLSNGNTANVLERLYCGSSTRQERARELSTISMARKEETKNMLLLNGNTGENAIKLLSSESLSLPAAVGVDIERHQCDLQSANRQSGQACRECGTFSTRVACT